MEPDFSGYATKAGLKCSDGRTITPEAFKDQDKMTVPLVWQHGHNDPGNVLGHAILEYRDSSHPGGAGMYCEGFFNDTQNGQNAKKLVEHKDIRHLSIWANQLVEKAKTVLHGAIREVSLVLSGANPGALIDYVRIAHSDDPTDYEISTDEAVIFTGLEFEVAHSADGGDKKEKVVAETKPSVQDVVKAAGETQAADAKTEEDAQHAATDTNSGGKTVQDIYDTLDAEQKDVVHFMIGAALEASASASHSDTNENELSDQKGTEMKHNVFESADEQTKVKRPTLSHDQLKTIAEDAQKLGSFKESFLAHAVEYGIEDIDILFPDAKSVTSSPDFISRRMEWVASVIDGAKHSPFSRIKSQAADITAEEARAKGYVKGNKKKDEIIKLLKRVTTPTTIYKKQKLDRDDIVDITDLDVVAWLKAEMRLMLDEELARAVLVGDGREPDDEDKINEDAIRPIAYDDEMYAHPITVPSNTTADGYVEAILRSRKYYKGTGTPTLFTTDDVITDMLLSKDKIGRRLYNNEAELAQALRVDKLVPVEVLEDYPDIVAIIVNMADYTLGADRGGNISMFDDFDIDYNQYKYLIETRCSGALTKPKSALVLRQDSGTTVTPTTPTFVPETNTVTIPTVAGVTYYDVTDPLSESTLTPGDHVITETTDVEARANAGYSFPHNTDADWTFAYTA
jgi:hypothetical protein